MSDGSLETWPATSIGKSGYLKGRIGWQGLRASEFTDEGPYLITGTDFDEGRINWETCYRVSESRFQEAPYIHVKNGDLLITKDGTIGKIAYVADCPEKAVLNSGIFLLRCKDGSFEHEYLYYVLNSNLFEKFLRQHLAGSTINHLYQHVFVRFEFPVPKEQVQPKIVRVLGKVDRAIESTRSLITKYRRIKDGLMHDLFTRGVTEDGKLRPPRDQAPELYKETPLGPIPVDWEWDSIGNLSEFVTSGSRGWATYYSEEGAKFIRIGNLSRLTRRIDLQSVQHVNVPKLSEGTRTAIKHGDILISITADLGIIGIADERLENAYVNQHIALVRLRSDGPTSAFVGEYLSTDAGQRQFVRFNDAGAKAGLNLPTIRQMLVAYPKSPAESGEITSLVSRCDQNIECVLLHLTKLQHQKAGLMNDLLTGKKPVDNIVLDPPESSHV